MAALGNYFASFFQFRTRVSRILLSNTQSEGKTINQKHHSLTGDKNIIAANGRVRKPKCHLLYPVHQWGSVGYYFSWFVCRLLVLV
ncbi:hypothetical protein DEO72_LG4g195 [Vigna unguiculata]|uniref:Uncharacterized protein n=1 Tax=Vigna unguiculata TaxID=3917 RepID=A0A4D6LKJ1_VIGUN|nr:hypothetical protein DEO72_LG4g195 [Vigna unguiculata]